MGQKRYDVIIIGAGIAGLVCGCFLSQKGYKVLILEQHYLPGGYCGCFYRKGFKFNTVLRGLSGFGAGGILSSICEKLDIEYREFIRRANIYDIFRIKDYTIKFWNDPLRTLSDLTSLFPREKDSLNSFYSLLAGQNFYLTSLKYANKTFQDVLDYYFRNPTLKFIFSVLRIESVLAPSLSSAVADLTLLRGNIFDGGYYSLGGMQILSNAFVKKFRELGGEIKLRNLVTEIKLKDGTAQGVITEKREYYSSRYVVANCDVYNVFSDLLKIPSSELNRIKKMKVGHSAFIVHLGIKGRLNLYSNDFLSLWYCPDPIREKEFTVNKRLNSRLLGICCCFPSILDRSLAPEGCESVFAYTAMPYRNLSFWKKHRSDIEEKILLSLMEIVPDIKKRIIVKSNATPITLNHYTMNYKGSTRGWHPILSQTKRGLISENCSIKNLFLTGHWITSPYGNGAIPLVAANGRKVARMISLDKHQ